MRVIEKKSKKSNFSVLVWAGGGGVGGGGGGNHFD